MKLLISGGSGFVGGAFCAAYCDRFEIERFSFRGGLDDLVIDGIDVVIHFAALVHQMQGAPEALYEEINVEKTVALAEKAKAAGVKQFVFMSSIKACGEESEQPYAEDSACHPQDAYGKSKRQAEQRLGMLEDESFKIAIVRAPLVYGEGVKANMRSFIRLVDRFSILPFGGLKNKRSMVYVGNLTHLVSEIILQGKSGVFLAVDDAPVSTAELAESIARALGKEVRLVRVPFFGRLLKMLRPGLHRRLYQSLYVDNTRTVEALGLKTPFSFDEGVRRMVGDYREHRH